MAGYDREINLVLRRGLIQAKHYRKRTKVGVKLSSTGVVWFSLTQQGMWRCWIRRGPYTQEGKNSSLLISNWSFFKQSFFHQAKHRKGKTTGHGHHKGRVDERVRFIANLMLIYFNITSCIFTKEEKRISHQEEAHGCWKGFKHKQWSVFKIIATACVYNFQILYSLRLLTAQPSFLCF